MEVGNIFDAESLEFRDEDRSGSNWVHTAPVPEPKLPIATNTQFWVQITGPVFIPNSN